MLDAPAPTVEIVEEIQKGSLKAANTAEAAKTHTECVNPDLQGDKKEGHQVPEQEGAFTGERRCSSSAT